MTTTLAINTCSLDPEAGKGSSSGAKPYEQRAFVLRNFILPAAVSDPGISEVIVVGSWEDGPGYTYVPKPSVNFNCTDTLHQRQAAFEASTGDLVIFCHDDHLLDLTFNNARVNLAGYMRSHDVNVLVPARYTRLRNIAGERLNSGEPAMWQHGTSTREELTEFAKEAQRVGYIPGHCAIYERKVIEQCPWSGVPEIFAWDTQHTNAILTAGFRVQHSTLVRVWDVEEGSTPWV